MIYEEALENYVLEDAKLSDKVNAYYKGENAKLPRRKASAPEKDVEETPTEKISKSVLETSEVNGVTESTIKISDAENNFSEVEGVNLENSEKDVIHNTKTNLFVDEDKVVLGEENSPEIKEEVSPELEIEKAETINEVEPKLEENFVDNTEIFLDSSEENRKDDTIIFKTSDEGVFNATEETRLKEDKDDI